MMVYVVMELVDTEYMGRDVAGVFASESDARTWVDAHQESVSTWTGPHDLYVVDKWKVR